MSTYPPYQVAAEAASYSFAAPTPPDANQRIANVFGALSYPHRFMILLILGEGPRTVSSLAEEFPGASDQFVSRHLGTLRRCGLVEDQVDGQFRVYALTDLGSRLLQVVEAVGEL